MNLARSRTWKLRTRVTVFTLAIFLVILWAMTLYVSRVLREDAQTLVGAQQSSTAAVVASSVNHELVERLDALQVVADAMTPAVLADTAALQTLLQQRPILQNLFNGGVLVTGADDLAMASLPKLAWKLPFDAALQQFLREVRMHGMGGVGPAFRGGAQQRAMVAIAVPVQDGQARVLAVLTGFVNLADTNFLDRSVGIRYGKSGGYVLVAPRDRVIVTATDRRRILEPSPPAGAYPLIDQFLQGQEITGVSVNPRGVEMLMSARTIPVAGWYLATVLPTEEAYAPIQAMQWRMLWVGGVLTVLAAVACLWMLRRQLAPLLAATRALELQTQASQTLQALPVGRNDEIGELIGGFNRLIQIVDERERSLRSSSAFAQDILNSVTPEIAVLNQNGEIVAVNEPWRRFARENAPAPGQAVSGMEVGANYLTACAGLGGVATEEAQQATQGILSVLQGRAAHFSMEYACHSPSQQRWFNLSVTPLSHEASDGVVVVHENITQRRLSEAGLMNTLVQAQRFRNALDHVTSCICIKDTDSRYLYANQASLNLFGCTAEQVVGREDGDFFPPATVQRLRAIDVRVLAGEETAEEIDVVDPKSGRRVYWEVKTPIYTDSEQRIVAGLCSISTDITELRMNQESQALLARRAEALLELPIAAQTLDQNAFMQHGLDLAEQLTESRIAFVHFVHDDQETIELVTWSRSTLEHYCQAAYDKHYPVSQAGIWADALRQRAPVVCNDYSAAANRRGLPPGHAGLDRLISVPVIEGGLVRMMVGVGNKSGTYSDRDVETVQLLANTVWHIVRKRRSEDELRESEARHRFLADNARDVIWTMDLQGNINYVSRSVERLLGFSSEEAQQQTLEQVLTAQSYPLAKAGLEKFLADFAAGVPDSEFRGELEMNRKDGTTLWTEVTAGGLRNSQGEFVGVLGVTRDISERRRADERIGRLTKMYAALSRSNEAIVRSTEPAELFASICRLAVEIGGMSMAWIGLVDEGGQDIAPVASFGASVEYLAELKLSLNSISPFGQGPTATAIRENRPIWTQDFLRDPATAAWHARAQRFGYAASAALPLLRGGAPVGALNLYAVDVNAFDADLRDLLMEMAEDISYAIDAFARESERLRITQALSASEEQNRAITQSAYEAIITSDDAGNIAGWNRGASVMFGYDEAEVLGQPMTALMPQRYRQRHLEGMRRICNGEEAKLIGKTVELTGLRKGGQEFALELTLARWESSKGWYVTGIIGDITERKAQQTQLRLAAQVFAQGREGIIVADERGHIVMANQAFTQITGYSESEVLGQNPRMLSSGRHDASFYSAMWQTIDLQGHWSGEIWNRRKDGSVYPEWLAISAMRDEHGRATHYIGSFSDLSDAKAAENRIHWLSNFDVLTGLPNRTLLQDRTLHALTMAQRAGEALTVMLVGVDHFNTLNDTLTRETIDLLLVELAKRLSASVREQDTVARLGGREFVLVLPSTAAAGAAKLANQLLQALAQAYKSDPHEITLSASIGVAIYPEDGQDFDALLKSAVIALHRAQEKATQSFQFYSAEMSQQLQRRDLMVKALRRAAQSQELDLVYQPLADLQTGQICGLEALLRWSHPELGQVSPMQFIPLAEEFGIIKPLGEWVLQRACQDIRRWLDKGIAVPHVAINVSPVQFHDNDLVAQVREALARSQVEPGRLYLELTESAVMKDVSRSEEVLRELKELGIRLSLDDFGTGYSSLSYLKRFPIDQVKIDQSFIRDITSNTSDMVLVEVMVSMAHGLGMRVVAEGVETEAQCESVRASVCDEVQGYFFSRPVSAAALEELVLNAHALPPHLLRFPKPQSVMLLVDDEPNIVAALKRLFRRDGHIILTANSGTEGLEVLAQNKVDVIISDQRMPGMTGVEFLRAAKQLYPDTIRIVLSGYTELQSVTDAINEGAVYRFLTKPWEDEQLREHIQQAFEYKNLLEKNRALDIKIRTTNQELVAANRTLGEVLHKTRHQVERDNASLAIVREALQHIPLPVIGVDDEGLMVFVNASAQREFVAVGALLGVELEFALPQLESVLASCAEGQTSHVQIGSDHYQVEWRTMGSSSQSRGKIVTLTPVNRKEPA